MAELVDATDSKPVVARHESSSLSPGTMNILYVILGGAVGSALRYLLSTFTQSFAKTPFPAGIFAVNIIGAFCAGFLFHVADLYQLSSQSRLLIFTGILGGFTTFSAYALDTFSLFRGNETSLALLNIILTNVVGIAFLYIGYMVSKNIF